MAAARQVDNRPLRPPIARWLPLPDDQPPLPLMRCGRRMTKVSTGFSQGKDLGCCRLPLDGLLPLAAPSRLMRFVTSHYIRCRCCLVDVLCVLCVLCVPCGNAVLVVSLICTTSLHQPWRLGASARASSERRARRHAYFPAVQRMVAKVSCNLTPRNPPSQVVDNLPRYAG